MPQQIIAQAAEAIILKDDGKIIKRRIAKGYRIPELDKKLRARRTRSEAKLLEKASSLINVPKVIKVDEKNKEITMSLIEGLKLSENLEKLNWKEICKQIGEETAKIHDLDIIHGDLTTSNMILVENSEGNNNLIANDSYLLKRCLPVNLKADEDLINKSGLTTDTSNSSIKRNSEKLINTASENSNNCKDLNLISAQANNIQGLTINKKVSNLNNVDNNLKNDLIINNDRKSINPADENLIINNFKNNSVFFIDFGLGFHSSRIEDKAVDLHLLKQALEAKHFTIWQDCFKLVLENYNSKDKIKTLKQLEKVEARGRYKH